MSEDWRLAWVKTRTAQGLSGAFEEVVAWKEADPEYLKRLARILVAAVLPADVLTAALKPTDPPDTLVGDGRPGSDTPQDEG